MMETTGDAEYDNNYEVAGDALEFILSWINNSIEITKLNVTTGKDNTMNIKFGSPIESNYSEKNYRWTVYLLINIITILQV